MSVRPVLRKLMFAVLVFAVVWAITIMVWRNANVMPSGQDMALYGLGLPLVILAVVGVGVGINNRGKAKRGAETEAGPVAAAIQAAGDDPALKRTIVLLDSSVCLPGGNSVEQVSMLAQEEQRVALHDSLHFADGTQVFASQVDAVTAERFVERLLPAQYAGELDDEHRRALLLAADALDMLLERHAVAREEYDDGRINRADESPFQLHWLLPQRWEHVAAAFTAWLGAHMAQGEWQPGVASPRVVFVADAVQALAAVDALQDVLHDDASNSHSRHIVLACDSWLSQGTVAAWEDSGRLYGQKHADGRIPGEGACALLLAREEMTESETSSRVHRLVSARRQSSADQAVGRRDGTTVDLIANARETTAEPGLQMLACAMVSDADQRVSRMMEMISTAERAWPDGESDGRCQHLGLANGESGAVLALSALAVAAAHGVQTGQPTFAVSVSDPWARAVVLVSPPEQSVESEDADDRLAA